MATIVLLNGETENKELFCSAIKENRGLNELPINVSNWYFTDEFGEKHKYSSGGNFEINSMACDNVESFICGCSNSDKIVIIENYDHRLSRMLQDDFMVFEIEVNKTGILSAGNVCFCLNVLDEDFEKQAKELVSKLSI